MSDTNRVALGIVEETTVGTTPTSPVFTALRITGTPELGANPVTVISDEIRSDRQVADLILVGKEAGGNVGMELSFDAQGLTFEGVLGSDWTYRPTLVNTAADSDIVGITDSSALMLASLWGSTLDFGSSVAGSLIAFTGFGDSGNNGVFFMSSVSGNTSFGYTLSLSNASAVSDAAPAAGARIRTVGFQGGTGTLSTTATTLVSAVATTGPRLDFLDLGFDLVIGEWIKIGGPETINQFATAACNGWARISAIAQYTLTFDVVPTGFTTDNGSAKDIQFFVGDYIRNSTTEKSYSLERQFQDQSSILYEVFTGMHMNTMTVQARSQSIVTASINFMGFDAAMDTVRTAGATDTDAPTNTVLNSSSNVGRIAENGTAISTNNYVLEMSIIINNNLRRQNAVGSDTSIGIGYGEFNVKGSLSTYFDDKTLADKVIDNTSTSLDIRFGDSSDHVILIDLPTVKYSSGSPQVAGKNQDVVLNLEYQAIRNTTLDYTIHVQQFHDVEV